MKKSFLVAEVAQAHEGSVNLAISFIDLVKKAGYDAIKFQIHLSEFETTYNDKFRPGTKNFNSSRFEYWRKMELSLNDWIKISTYSKKVGLNFICSVFCNESIEILKKLPNLHSIKISSGEMYNKELIILLKKLNKPFIISTGMASVIEIKNLISFLKQNKINNYHLLHCVSSYPTKLEDANLSKVNFFKKNYNIQLGYSDHTGIKEVIMTAVSLNCPIIENHICFNKKIIGPDTSSSLLPSEMKEISEFNNIYNYVLNSNFSEKKINKINNVKKLFSKSLSLNKNIIKGDIIKSEDITLKKPGTGLKFEDRKKVIGRRARQNLSKYKLLKLSDLTK